ACAAASETAPVPVARQAFHPPAGPHRPDLLGAGWGGAAALRPGRDGRGRAAPLPAPLPGRTAPGQEPGCTAPAARPASRRRPAPVRDRGLGGVPRPVGPSPTPWPRGQRGGVVCPRARRAGGALRVHGSHRVARTGSRVSPAPRVRGAAVSKGPVAGAVAQ